MKVLFIFITLLSFNSLASDSEDFLLKIFNEIPKAQRLWINNDIQSEIKKRINPSQIKLSYRYWQKDNLTVWILNELGKERNITTAILVENNKIQTVEVLTYRESRGGQVQSKRFSNQYHNKDLNSNLVKEIDSISGATLSVNALNKQVILALFLNSLRKTND